MECVPDWIFLNDAGHGRDPQQSRPCNDGKRARLESDADLAFFSYFESIPKSIRSLIAPLGVHQWSALDCINQDPEFCEFVDALQGHNQINYLSACFSLADITRRKRLERNRFARDARSMPRVAFLKKLSEEAGLDAGIWSGARLRLLYKLSQSLDTRDAVVNFLNATADPEIARCAAHVRRLSVEGLNAFGAIRAQWPGIKVLPRTLEVLSVSPVSELIPDWLEEMPAEVPTQNLQSAFNELRYVRDEDEVYLWMAHMDEERILSHYAGMPFPKPPISGDNRLVPLTSCSDVEREARRMRNCLRTHIGKVFRREAYFYHWSAMEEATVELSRGPDGTWGLTEALARGNRPLSYRERESIEEHVVGLLEPVRVTDPDLYEGEIVFA